MSTTGPNGWLKNSLEHRVTELRGAERKCRGAYHADTAMREAADRLADTYGHAAEVFERALGLAPKSNGAADRAVLSALRGITDGELETWALGGGARAAVGKAEIARRSVARG